MAGPGVAYPTATTEVGVAVEVTRGTAVAPAYWIPVKSPKYKPDLTLIPDETLQGSMVAVYNLVPGMRYDSHGWEAPPYLDTFPVFVRAELGSTDTVTAAPAATTLAASAAVGATTVTTVAAVAAGSWIVIGLVSNNTLETHLVKSVAGDILTLAVPLIFAQPSGAVVTGLTKHQFSLLNNADAAGNQPPSLTITDFDGEEWRQLTAAQLDELSIKGNATGLVNYTTTFFANAATTPSAPSPSFSGQHSPAPWAFQVLIGGTQVTTITEWEFTFKRGVKPIPALTGTQAYFLYFASTLQATGKLTFVEQTGAPQITAYLNGTVQSFDFTLFDVVTGNALNIHCTNGQYKTSEVDRSKEYVEVPVELQFLPSTADALAGGVSPVLITCANAQAASY